MTQPHGMLFVATHIDAADEADFNQWYDHEHVEERVAISGFLSGTRYQAVDAERKLSRRLHAPDRMVGEEPQQNGQSDAPRLRHLASAWTRHR